MSFKELISGAVREGSLSLLRRCLDLSFHSGFLSRAVTVIKKLRSTLKLYLRSCHVPHLPQYHQIMQVASTEAGGDLCSPYVCGQESTLHW